MYTLSGFSLKGCGSFLFLPFPMICHNPLVVALTSVSFASLISTSCVCSFLSICYKVLVHVADFSLKFHPVQHCRSPCSLRSETISAFSLWSRILNRVDIHIIRSSCWTLSIIVFRFWVRVVKIFDFEPFDPLFVGFVTLWFLIGTLSF